MSRLRQSTLTSSWGWVAAGVGAILLVGGSVAHSAITVTGDPAWPETPNVFTVDPFLYTNANRGITQDRKLRQTFKVPETFTVGEVILTFDVTGGEGGLALRFYEVDDVLAGDWTPGTLLKTLTVTGSLGGSTQRLGFELSGGDLFELPARSAGTTGYGIEISTANASPSDPNPGVLYFTNDGTPVDYYADGRYYVEGGASNAYRDVGLALVASGGPAPDPGDVDGDGDVDLDDLQVILDNFRQPDVGAWELGDLTGDGNVDLLDFREWKANYPGAGAGAGALLPVPEPTALSLAGLGVVAGCAMARRRRHASLSCAGKEI